MSDQPSLPTDDELEKLPLRAVVAYAVQCARRVQPPYYGVAGVVMHLRYTAGANGDTLTKRASETGDSTFDAAVEFAIQAAEEFCVGGEFGHAAALAVVVSPRHGRGT